MAKETKISQGFWNRQEVNPEPNWLRNFQIVVGLRVASSPNPGRAPFAPVAWGAYTAPPHL